MTTSNVNSLDLSKEFTRSPRATLAGYVIAARTLDKCRAVIAGTAGEYHFDCPLDQLFLTFAGITAENFKAFVTTGADNAAVAEWIQATATEHTQEELVQWNNDLRSKRISEMPIELQLFLEGYVAEFIPSDKIVYTWFDVYDIEEQRI
jgi:hypothetical protein